MSFVEDDEMVQTISADGSDNAFRIRIRVHRRLQSIGLILRDVLRSLIHSTHTQGASMTAHGTKRPARDSLLH